MDGARTSTHNIEVDGDFDDLFLVVSCYHHPSYYNKVIIVYIIQVGQDNNIFPAGRNTFAVFHCPVKPGLRTMEYFDSISTSE